MLRPLAKVPEAVPGCVMERTHEIRYLAPEVCVSAKCQSSECPPHRDLNNASGYPLPCSRFWVESDDGDELCPDSSIIASQGKVLEFSNVVVFDPHLLRATCRWQGDRVILAAFSARDFNSLPEKDVRQLRELGFRLPRLPQWGVASNVAIPKPLQSVCPVAFELCWQCQIDVPAPTTLAVLPGC